MKWNTAVKKIEKALEEGKHVEIHYHRKWMVQDYHWDVVENVSEYDWYGQTCKSVSTYRDLLDEDSYIIDDIDIED